MRILFSLLFCGVLMAEPALMPMPAKMERLAGTMPVDVSFRIAYARMASPRLQRAGARFLGVLAAHTGIPVKRGLAASVGAANLIIDCAQTVDGPLELGEDESYKLQVGVEQARLTARTVTGAMRGLQTFLQLVELGERGYGAASVAIEDAPRFPWRGLLIDVTSHFMPVPVIERTLDAMEAVKLNVFHWHLTDDQGFRVESKVFPKLHTLGTEGDFYTQEEIRRVIGYARDRGIRVLPEFDMPGHSGTWLIGYPELGSAPGPYSIIHTFGVYDPALDPTKEAVYAFIDRLVGEMAALFPDAYFHIGGDEVNGRQWKANAGIQAFIRERGLKDEAGLQTYFNQRVLQIVKKHGKRMMGWDEILHPALPKDIVVESWQNHVSLAKAAAEGYRGLLSFGYYLDHLKTAGEYYSVDPFRGPGAALTSEQRKNVLGGEACMWTEFISPETIDSRMWPKSAAVAERLWSPMGVTDEADMYRRLDVVSGLLTVRGARHELNYEAMLRRIGPVEAVRVLADTLEPRGIAEREVFQRYTQETQLNRLVDAARGDSAVVRQFERDVRAWLETRDSAKAEAVRRVLTMWRDNHARLLGVENPLLKEYLGVSADLAKLGEMGLAAMEGKVESGWSETVKEMGKVRLEVVLGPARGVGMLVRAMK